MVVFQSVINFFMLIFTQQFLGYDLIVALGLFGLIMWTFYLCRRLLFER